MAKLCIALVGLPAMGKSTVASKLQDGLAEDYKREFREINRQLDRIENRVSAGVQHFTDRTIPPGQS